MGLKERAAAWPVIGTVLEVLARAKRDAVEPLAAAIGFFSFLSLFPLLLLAVAGAGFVLDDPADQVRIAESLAEAIPGLEATLDDGTGTGGVDAMVATAVERRGTIGLVGLVTLLLTGLKVVNAAMVATRVVFRGALLTGLGIKLRQLGALVGLGSLALLAAVGSTVAGTGLAALPAWASVALAAAVSFLLDLALFVGAYRLLSPTSAVRVRGLVPGAMLAAAGWTLLKVAGASYLGSQAERASALYGALGGVVALLLLFYLAGRLYLYGAELSAVLLERRRGAPLHPPADDTEVDGDSDHPAAAPRAAPAGTTLADPPDSGPVPASRRRGLALALAVAVVAVAWRAFGDRDG